MSGLPVYKPEVTVSVMCLCDHFKSFVFVTLTPRQFCVPEEHPLPLGHFFRSL